MAFIMIAYTESKGWGVKCAYTESKGWGVKCA